MVTVRSLPQPFSLPKGGRGGRGRRGREKRGGAGETGKEDGRREDRKREGRGGGHTILTTERLQGGGGWPQGSQPWLQETDKVGKKGRPRMGVQGLGTPRACPGPGGELGKKGGERREIPLPGTLGGHKRGSAPTPPQLPNELSQWAQVSRLWQGQEGQGSSESPLG